MTWFILFKFAAALLVSYVLRPKNPSQQDATPQAQETPDTQEGTPVSVVFGTIKKVNPATLWYGDLQQDPIYPDDEGGKKG